MINLKNNYSLKKCWIGSIKYVEILIFTMLYFFKKIEKTSGDIYFKLLYQKSWYDLQFLRYRVWQTENHSRQTVLECDRLKLVIMGHLLRFYSSPSPVKNSKNQNFGKMKTTTADTIILLICTKKLQTYDVGFLRYGVGDRIFCLFGPFFAPFHSKQNFKK